MVLGSVGGLAPRRGGARLGVVSGRASEVGGRVPMPRGTGEGQVSLSRSGKTRDGYVPATRFSYLKTALPRGPAFLGARPPVERAPSARESARLPSARGSIKSAV